MIPLLNALLVCVIFPCAFRSCSALSPRGRCTENHCFALFQESEDFAGARKSCEDSFGQLLMFSSRDVLTVLPSGLSGSYWLELRAEEALQGLRHVCSSISVSTGRNFTVLWEPCSDNLNGFLCQYTLKDPCSGLQAAGGAQVVLYTAPMGFEVRDSETFPRGTIAVQAEKVGAVHPATKNVCFDSEWLRAPWNCEVLRGGCEHGCNSTTHTCLCPAGQTLHPNRITCVADQCVNCAHGCQPEGDPRACTCSGGYELSPDRMSCVDVNECRGENPCTGDGEECENTPGAFECRCTDGFVPEDGVCVDVRICTRCEHMRCDKVNGVYTCSCMKGYKVSAADPAKCEMHCAERDCPASCVLNPDVIGEDMDQCFCPDGFILDWTNSTPICTDINECEQEMQCDHRCENSFGGFKCLCREGFKLHKGYMCVAIPEEGEEEGEEEGLGDGSGSSSPHPTLASINHPSAVPSYIKTGSILGITVFMLLAAMLLFFLVHNAVKRCGRFELPPIKHSNIDIFYLQQVTTETYKRLSVDKRHKTDSQIL